ncbi:DUF3311 domain-containing protein [Stratiformator vulcanicus]|uniref:DUF3311 domain-containing protein n=1 Tax=Stratiformator vulcanicus TaxID=2527980 RepID=A0A517R0M5_9PLAN|nr:DUF3311 domain-containing protein [Stratiformator vulcanicus]QDT37446.1 hypothetical protein Pan189_18260 [Stratiformator vulcanicus]
MRYVVWGLVVLLIVLHQDVWYWDDATLVFGFIPIGLFYHACISVAAAFTWFLATKFAWPQDLIEETVAEVNPEAGSFRANPVNPGGDAEAGAPA